MDHPQRRNKSPSLYSLINHYLTVFNTKNVPCISTFCIYYFRIGLLQADTGVIREKKQFCRLFFHEAQRVFHDRLIDREDKQFFNEMLAELSAKIFGEVSLLVISAMLPN